MRCCAPWTGCSTGLDLHDEGPVLPREGVRGVLGRGSGISGEGREVETALECNRAGVTAILNWLRLASLIRPNGGSLSPALTTAFSSVDCGCMHAGLALGRERVAFVGVSRPDLSVGAVDEELAALVAGHTPGDVDGLRLRACHPVGPARAFALDLPGAVAPLGHVLVSRGHSD